MSYFKPEIRFTKYEIRYTKYGFMVMYSYSRISTFEQCPLKYKFAYVDKIKRRRTTIEAFLGSRFHEVMEHLYKRALLKQPDLESLKQFFNNRWEQEWNEEILLVNTEKTAADYQVIGLKSIDNYFKRYQPFDEGTVLGLERDVITDLDGTGKYKLRCVIDRLICLADGMFEIHDYKTSGLLPVQQQLDDDKQLALYEIAVRNAWPQVESVDLVWHFVAFDMEMRSRRSPDQLAQLKSDTISLIDTIESTNQFPPKESSLCDWCDFQDICPLFAHRFHTQEFGKIDYEKDDGQALVNAFASLDAQKHELMARIKGIETKQDRIKQAVVNFAEKQGIKRLFGDNYVLNIKDDVKVQYPKRDELNRHDFEEKMKQTGLWEQVIDVSWPQLKAVVEREGWTESISTPEALREYLNVEKIKRVRLAKRKDKRTDDSDDS